MTYPNSWTSDAGHEVVVLNPCEGHYDFHILATDGKKETMVIVETPGAEGTRDSLNETQKQIFDEWSRLR